MKSRIFATRVELFEFIEQFFQLTGSRSCHAGFKWLDGDFNGVDFVRDFELFEVFPLLLRQLDGLRHQHLSHDADSQFVAQHSKNVRLPEAHAGPQGVEFFCVEAIFRSIQNVVIDVSVADLDVQLFGFVEQQELFNHLLGRDSPEEKPLGIPILLLAFPDGTADELIRLVPLFPHHLEL